jgi:hypothetical protein
LKKLDSGEGIQGNPRESNSGLEWEHLEKEDLQEIPNQSEAMPESTADHHSTLVV